MNLRTLFRFSVLSATVVSFTFGQQVTYKLSGIGFSPYLSGQDPNQNLTISQSQIQQRMAIVAPYTNWVRTFGCTHGLDKSGVAARGLGLKVAIGIWIGRDSTANSQEIACGVAVAQSGQADMVIVGSETLLRGDVSEQQLVAYIQTVRQQVPSNIPVTSADIYGILLAHPAIIQASDVVMANFYQYWEGYSINTAVSGLHLAYKQLVAAANGKAVLVSETGWPSAGNAVGAAVPSPANASAYFINFVSWAKANNVQYFYFEAFDEAWKAQYEGPQGAAWGLWDQLGNLKPGMQPVFDGQTAPDNWSGSELPGGPGTPSVALTFVAPVGDSRPVYGNVLHVRPADYKIALYIQVFGNWWTKPFFNQPLTSIQSDGTFFSPIVTGGSDAQSTRVHAFVVPNGYNPPLLAGSSTLPAELTQNSVANVEVIRGADSICGKVTDGSGGFGLSGATISLNGGAISAQSVATGEFCFPNLTHGANYTGTAALTNYVFTPPSQSVTGLSGNAIMNFTANGVPGAPSVPIPSNGATGISPNVTIGWTNSGSTTSNDFLFGTTNPPPFLANASGSTYTPGALNAATKYYWQVVARNAFGATPSPVWSFTTQGQEIGSVDIAGNASGVATVLKGATMYVIGWAADTATGAPVQSVTVFVDGVSVGTATLGFALSDVANYYGRSDYTNSGWSFQMSTSALSLGQHTVTARTVGSSGTLQLPSRTVNITAQGQEIGSLDIAGNSGGGGTVLKGGTLYAIGWAADTATGAPVQSVTVFVDGVSVGTATLGFARSDVANYYARSDYTNSGWSFQMSTSALSFGSHTVTATVAGPSGTAQLGSRTINIQGQEIGALDIAGNASGGSTVVKGSTLYVMGWAADTAAGAPVQSVTVFVDGASVGTATLGVARSDVANYYGRSDYTNSGWTLQMSTSALSVGAHTVTATAQGQSGTAQVGSRSVNIQ
ncbi:MAG TPA: glycosyl hydrolase family 17 protein [Bryobacteraceae bacterium]